MTPDKNHQKINKKPLVAVTVFFSVFVIFAFLAPLFMYLDLKQIGEPIYDVYKFVCHQRAERSLFLFGQDFQYSPEQVESFGITSILESREFLGSETLGYKVAFCFRDLGIYLAMAILGWLFVLIKRLQRIEPIKFKFILLGTLPIALDGGLQLLAEFLVITNPEFLPFTFNEPFYLSNNLKRLVTGAIFGTTVGLWLYPSIIKEFNINKTTNGKVQK